MTNWKPSKFKVWKNRLQLWWATRNVSDDDVYEEYYKKYPDTQKTFFEDIFSGEIGNFAGIPVIENPALDKDTVIAVNQKIQDLLKVALAPEMILVPPGFESPKRLHLYPAQAEPTPPQATPVILNELLDETTVTPFSDLREMELRLDKIEEDFLREGAQLQRDIEAVIQDTRVTTLF